MALWWFFLALASEFLTEGQAEPSVRAECGGQYKPQERQYPTAGWDNLLQVGAVSQSTVIPWMKHCRSGFCSFPSALTVVRNSVPATPPWGFLGSVNLYVLEEMISSNVGLPLLGVATGISQHIQAEIHLLLVWKAHICSGCTNNVCTAPWELDFPSFTVQVSQTLNEIYD